MIDPICPHCQNTGFEVRSEAVAGSSQKLAMVRCAACGAPVSLIHPADIGEERIRREAELHEFGLLVSELHRRLMDLEGRLESHLRSSAR
jgi:hypothetical protein